MWKSYIANNKLFIVLLFSFLGNVLAWLHMNAQFKWDWAKETWWIILGGVPISFLFYYSTRLSYEHFGQFWAIRPLGFGMATIIGMWFALQADISEAKELPKPDVTRMEFDMKDQNVRQTIMTTQEDVKEIKEDMRRIEDKIDQLR